MSVQALTAALAVRDVTASEKLVLMLLANYADEHMQCWPSHRKLAEDACLTERTVLTILKGLEAHAIIERVERRRRDGSRSSDVITLNLGGETISPRGEIDDRGVGKPFPQGGEIISPLTTFEPKSKPSTDTASEPEGFAEWYAAYPKKVGVGHARKAYRSALKKTQAKELLRALASFEFPTERRFVPHPATWLNAESWLDAPADTPAARPEPETDPWPKRLRGWAVNRYWHSDWGPKPGAPGCVAPELELTP